MTTLTDRIGAAAQRALEEWREALDRRTDVTVTVVVKVRGGRVLLTLVRPEVEVRA